MMDKMLIKAHRKAEAGEKIRVGFGVVFDGVFPMAPVYELMLADPFFDPFIAVIPDISRGRKHEFEQMARTYTVLKREYGEVIKTFNPRIGKYLPVSPHCDLWCTANLYDSMTNSFYASKNLSKCGIPTFYAGYGFIASQKYAVEMEKPNGLYSNFWRVYTANMFEFNALIKARPENSVAFCGYPKMDALPSNIQNLSNRKKIIIAPHHTVNREKGNVNFGNFLSYADFFLELPKFYPEIDFVFRPHPLLFPTLVKENLWREAKCSDYLHSMELLLNVEIQMGGSYLKTFSEADAIIHDCGSFIAEWLYTSKPGCYMIKDASLFEYNDFAKECIETYYWARNKDDIKYFIKNIVIDNHDEKKGSREEITKKLLYNHPNVAKSIIYDLKNLIMEL